jgi:hypothetical protein
MNWRKKMNDKEQISMEDYVQEELEKTKTPLSIDRLPTLKLETGKITSFEVVVDSPFGEYVDNKQNKIKKIIPVMSKGVKHNLWLNVKNPLYRQILEKLAKGETKMYVSTIGSQDSTRYELQEFNV